MCGKWNDFLAAIDKNKYVQLSNQISALIDSTLFYGKYTTDSRYGDLFCKEKQDESK